MAPNIPYDVDEAQPPAPRRGQRGNAVNEPQDETTLVGGAEVASGSSEDTARYLLDPDTDFARPYLAVPGVSGGRGRAFVWPGGVEGFEVQEQAELGRHKYLGSLELDVDITHRAETTIVLSGTFPGWTSVQNMLKLRTIFYMESPERGKILHLPGILTNLAYVVCESLVHSHAPDDRTQDIEYTLTLVKVDTGVRDTTDAGGDSGSDRTSSSGSTSASSSSGAVATGSGSTTGAVVTASPPGTHSFKTTTTINTLRKIAQAVYHDSSLWTVLYNIPHNKTLVDNYGNPFPSHEIPDYVLPPGIGFLY